MAGPVYALNLFKLQTVMSTSLILGARRRKSRHTAGAS
jgi:hypothetical protein